jgi:hypothetical protein
MFDLNSCLNVRLELVPPCALCLSFF